MKRLAGLATLLALTAGPAGAVTATGTLTATVVRPISISHTPTSGLSFGKIVRPTSGSGTVTLSPTGARTPPANGFWLASPASTVPTFTVSGEGGQMFTLTVPASISMTTGTDGGGSLTVSISNSTSCGGSCTLSGALGGAGAFTFTLGGSFPISNTTATGAYSGSVTATATYN